MDRSPAAIVRQAADLRILAQGIRAEIAAGFEKHKAAVECFYRAGQLLIKAKDAAGHGQWKAFCKLQLNAVGERQIRRYMELGREESMSDLTAAWERINGNQRRGEDEPQEEVASNSITENGQAATPQNGRKLDGKPSVSKSDTVQEEEREEGPAVSPFREDIPVPQDLQNVLWRDGKRFIKAAKRVRNLSKTVWGLEQSDAWKTLARWERQLGGGAKFTKRPLSAVLSALAHDLEQMQPVGLCLECRGLPGGDAAEEVCQKCKGRGFMLACELPKEEKT